MKKQGILLVNLGTPDSPSVRDVRKFLKEFLMDPLVVDIPYLARWILVNFIIVPFRGPNSAKEYQMLWTEKGSPLKFHSESLLEKLKTFFSENFHLTLAMRYQNPDIQSALSELKDAGCEELLLVPLFPQYAECTSLSTKEKVLEELKNMNWTVGMKVIHSFVTDEGFIDALLDRSKTLKNQAFDHTIFSYHGLPERQLKKVYSGCLEKYRTEECQSDIQPNDHRRGLITSNGYKCCEQLTEANRNCYRAQCVATSQALADKLGLADDEYSICFQSRQGKQPWIQPYIDDVIIALAQDGIKQLRVFSPAFVADCLETTQEIAHTYGELFQQEGGEKLHLVPGLNDADTWVSALKNIISAELDADKYQQDMS